MKSFKHRGLFQYGLSEQEWRIILMRQHFRCAICRREFEEGTTAGTPCVDHCHRTDVVRGALCRQCNLGIGNLGDDVDTVERAYEYLLRADIEIRARPDVRILGM